MVVLFAFPRLVFRLEKDGLRHSWILKEMDWFCPRKVKNRGKYYDLRRWIRVCGEEKQTESL